MGEPFQAGAGAGRADPPVTVAVRRRVRRGSEAGFEDCLRGLIGEAMTVAGHLGVTVFRPPGQSANEYRIVFKFDRRSNLRLWLDSPACRGWLERLAEFEEGRPDTHVLTGMEAWFTLPAGPGVPPRWKMAVVTWLALYPVITLLLLAFGPVVDGLPLPLRTLALTAMMVPLMTYAVMPAVTRVFARWLHPKADGPHDEIGTAAPDETGLTWKED